MVMGKNMVMGMRILISREMETSEDTMIDRKMK
jgi:hypothetical protein